MCAPCVRLLDGQETPRTAEPAGTPTANVCFFLLQWSWHFVVVLFCMKCLILNSKTCRNSLLCVTATTFLLSMSVRIQIGEFTLRRVCLGSESKVETRSLFTATHDFHQRTDLTLTNIRHFTQNVSQNLTRARPTDGFLMEQSNKKVVFFLLPVSGKPSFR